MMRKIRSNEKKRKHTRLSCTTLTMQLVACIAFVLARPHSVNAIDLNVRSGDVPGLIHAIDRANRSGDASNRIALEAGTYTLTSVDNDADGPNGLPSITSVVTIFVSGSTHIGPSS